MTLITIDANADALSRLASPESSTFETDRIEIITDNLISNLCEITTLSNSYTMTQPDIDDDTLINAQQNDPDLQVLIEQIIEDEEVNSKKNERLFSLERNILFKNTKDGRKLIVVPTSLIERILHIYHNNDLVAHPASKRLYGFLRTRFYW